MQFKTQQTLYFLDILSLLTNICSQHLVHFNLKERPFEELFQLFAADWKIHKWGHFTENTVQHIVEANTGIIC